MYGIEDQTVDSKFALPSRLTTLSNENEDSLESREIGVRRKHFTPEHNDALRYILDGQQRLTTLYNTFNNFYQTSSDWQNTFNESLKI